MAQVWKDLWWPGTLHLGDGRVVTYRDADIRNGERQGNAMLAAGLRVPCCWEHDPDADPVTLSHSKPAHDTAWLAKGYFGEPVEFERRDDGALWGLLDVPDAKDLAHLAKVRNVSPKLNHDFRDETGRVWPGLTVGHVAATASPVQRRQYPVTLSRHGHPRSKDAHYLSFATPARPEPTMDPLQRIMTALATLGINVGDVTTVDDLATKVEAMAAADPADPQVLDGSEPAGPPDGTAPGPSMPPVMMSRFASYVERDKKDLSKRVDDLFATARVDGPTRDHLAGCLKETSLSRHSYKPDGSYKPLRVLVEIEAYERLPAGRFGTKPSAPVAPANLSHLAGVPRPTATARADAAREAQDQADAKSAMRKMAEDRI